MDKKQALLFETSSQSSCTASPVRPASPIRPYTSDSMVIIDQSMLDKSKSPNRSLSKVSIKQGQSNRASQKQGLGRRTVEFESAAMLILK
jgi:hypothetical protein